MRAWWLAILVLLAACEAPVTPGSAEACRVERLASLKLRPMDSIWLVDVLIDGKPAVMVLDTGANGSVLFDHAVKRLQARGSEDRYSVTGTGGTVFRRAVEIDSLTLGGQTTRALSMPELDGTNIRQAGFDGLLGMDVLGRYDIEFDGPSGTLALHRQRFCPAGPPPFEGVVATLRRDDLGLSRTNRPVIPVRLNDQSLRALLDTGASRTLVDAARSEAAGGSAPRGGSSPVGNMTSVAAGPVALRLKHFAAFEVGGVTYRNSDLWTANLGSAADIIVGGDILNRRRMWFSLASDTIYLGPYVPLPSAAPARADR